MTSRWQSAKPPSDAPFRCAALPGYQSGSVRSESRWRTPLTKNNAWKSANNVSRSCLSSSTVGIAGSSSIVARTFCVAVSGGGFWGVCVLLIELTSTTRRFWDGVVTNEDDVASVAATAPSLLTDGGADARSLRQEMVNPSIATVDWFFAWLRSNKSPALTRASMTSLLTNFASWANRSSSSSDSAGVTPRAGSPANSVIMAS
mmetsp:Transcript_18539/g.52785  ORF Transcript_18539/g.52785 Transcript_18539/m.52785 type:complete len:203 (+) Transcript_18539:582-1190(+)